MSETEAQERSVQSPKKGAKAKEVREVSPPPLPRLPETAVELFNALATTVEFDVDVSAVPAPSAEEPEDSAAEETDADADADADAEVEPAAPTGKRRYKFPWAGWASWKDARTRLIHFEKKHAGKVEWVAFNNSESNDGPMSLNAFPGRAFIERVTNCADACLELKASEDQGPRPPTPIAAVERWYKLGPLALATGLSDKESAQLAKDSVLVRTFVGRSDPKDCILDARDYGIGLTATEFPDTILSLNRGLKKTKPFLTGKHGQGASSTYQYSDLTLIASRKHGSDEVAFTLVEGRWIQPDGSMGKTPTYRYMIIDGKVPTLKVSKDVVFEPGTLVRHIGYNADFNAMQGNQSMYGLLLRSLAQPLLPIWLEQIPMRKGPGGPGHFAQGGRQIRGTVNVLERAYEFTLNPPPGKKRPQELSRILHRSSETYKLGSWEFGGREGSGDLGQVQITYWVVDPNGRSSSDALKNYVDPNKTVIFSLDGQTHAEESRSIVAGATGAKLWAVGKYTIVHIDCNGLDPRAKYEMFTSTREHVKDTPIRDMVIDELVRRLKLDKKLEELNAQLAAADVTTKGDKLRDDNMAGALKKYLKKAGIEFDKFIKRMEIWKTIEEEGDGPSKKTPPELVPIKAVEPPTYIQWKFKGESVKMWPGQKYSWLFETDAPPHYWNDADPEHSRIRVLASGVQYLGGGEMKGGRVRCHFKCPDDAKIGSKGMIQVQLDYLNGAAMTSSLKVEVVAVPPPKPAPTEHPDDGGDTGPTKPVKVTVKKRDFTEVEIPILRPIAIKRDHTLWNLLGWPLDPAYVGFSVRSTSGRIQLYYNEEFPPVLDMRRRLSKRSLEDAFIQRYELKLVLHTVFTLNYEFVDEDSVTTDTKKLMQSLLCASAESLALAAKTELEIEARLSPDQDNALSLLTEQGGTTD
ncbi:MAG: hypothetical protein H0T46_30135 [Deltaproteobacteria bacterium]|nr:hypothetical protein [Deltaproteobacteria bacterium]